MQLSKQAAGTAEAKEMMKPKGCLSKAKAAKTVVKPKAKVKVSSNVRYRARAPAAMASVPDLSRSGEAWQAHQSPSHGKGKGKELKASAYGHALQTAGGHLHIAYGLGISSFSLLSSGSLPWSSPSSPSPSSSSSSSSSSSPGRLHRRLMHWVGPLRFRLTALQCLVPLLGGALLILDVALGTCVSICGELVLT